MFSQLHRYAAANKEALDLRRNLGNATDFYVNVNRIWFDSGI